MLVHQHWIRNINKLTEEVVGFDVILMAPLYCRRHTRIRIPNPMATLCCAEHVHITQTWTWIPISYFCIGEECQSKSVPESISGNVNEPLMWRLLRADFFSGKKNTYDWTSVWRRIERVLLITRAFLWIKLLVVSGIQCNYLPEKELCSWVAVFVLV